ncbi:MAG: hypothetical protein AAB393_03170, partial [Bacteroidota bacterium]
DEIRTFVLPLFLQTALEDVTLSADARLPDGQARSSIQEDRWSRNSSDDRFIVSESMGDYGPRLEISSSSSV